MNPSLVSAAKSIPGVHNIGVWVYRTWKHLTFHGSINYWETAYRHGWTSGAGSIGRLARFKADVLNAFVAEGNVRTVIEFGCGDGLQLMLAQYPRYIGLDVSRTALSQCRRRFEEDRTKSFFLYDPNCFIDPLRVLRAELALSLDVIYHLIEDENFCCHMRHLFSAADRYVIIYSANENQRTPWVHVRKRAFSAWVTENCPEWRLLRKIDNPYPFDPRNPADTSISDFYIYKKSPVAQEPPR